MRCGCCAVSLLVTLWGCDQSDFSSEVVLPSNYRETFVQVRTCRSSIDHDLAYVTIWTSPAAAASYDFGPYPFPTGSLIVKEQYVDPTCSKLSGFSLMQKGGPRSDPKHGDWRWLRMDSKLRVVEDGKIARCALCHAQASCRQRDYVCAEL